MPWTAAIRLSANLPTTAHSLFITQVNFFFRIIHIYNIRVSMTQVSLFLLRSPASLRISTINLYIKSQSRTYFSISRQSSLFSHRAPVLTPKHTYN